MKISVYWIVIFEEKLRGSYGKYSGEAKGHAGHAEHDYKFSSKNLFIAPFFAKSSFNRVKTTLDPSTESISFLSAFLSSCVPVFNRS